MLHLVTIAVTLALLPGVYAQDDYCSRSISFVGSRVPVEALPAASTAGKPKPRASPKRTARVPATCLGLGVTVFRQSADGTPVRVDPTRPLATHDLIRFVIESNEPAYLYVFNTDERGDGAAMIYPSSRLNRGENRVDAHVLYEVPSGFESPRDRWFELQVLEGQTGRVTDRMIVVLSRQPLPTVPRGAQLVKLADGDPSYVWTPDAATWARLGVQANATATFEPSFGAPISKDEDAAGARIVRLPPTGPKPSSVSMASTASAPRIVTVFDLVH